MEDLRQDEQDMIKDLFGILDKDKEGSITSKELAVAFRALGREPVDDEVQGLVNEVDADGNGAITAAGFCNVLLRKMRATDTDEELREAFKVLDKLNQGFLTIVEFRDVYIGMGVKLDTEELEEIIREYDLDQDNRLNYEEFVNMMSTR